MSVAIKDLQDRYNRTITDAETVREKYKGVPGTNMTAEEMTRWDALLDEADATLKEIKLLEREDALKARANEAPPRPQLAEKARTMNPADQRKAAWAVVQRVKRGSMKADDAYEELLSWDEAAILSARRKQILDVNPHLTAAEHQAIETLGLALKALQANSDTAGGTLVMTEQYRASIIIARNAATFVRGLATVIPMDNAESLGVPTMTADVADADWTSELATGNADTALTTGKRSLSPHPLAKRILVSNKLLRQAAIDPEGLVRDRLAYKFGVTEEKAFLTGSGAQQPLGVFTPSADGIPTTQDYTDSVAGGATFIGDDWIGAKYKLRPPYWPNAKWIIHPTILAAVRSLKSTTGAYIWASGLAQGGIGGAVPGTISDQPYMVSEFAPATIAASKYIAVLGDFSYYWVVDALDFSIQRLIELYAATNQAGFIARAETDGMPVLGEAFVRMIQHS